MGTMTLPTSGVLCIDANIVIYTVERHPRYSSVLRPLWSSVAAGQVYIVVSELVLLGFRNLVQLNVLLLDEFMEN